MSEPFIVDALTLDAQRRASNPMASAWVSANAGSGKTHVLAQRVKRLLLGGAPPEKILCLTYTKAAAGNMANRILGELSSWVRMEEKKLRDIIAALDGRAPQDVGADELRRARRLLAEALETPGGLKIQTIHAFCEALLHQFPFEAGLAGSFRILDELQQNILTDESFEKALLSGSADIEAAVMRLTLDKNLDDLKKDIIAALPLLKNHLSRSENFEERVYTVLALPFGINEDAIAERILKEAALAEIEWPYLIKTLEAFGKEKEVRLAKGLRYASALSEVKRAQTYLEIFLKQDGDFFQDKSLISADLKKKDPALAKRICGELPRLAPLYQQLKYLRLAQDNIAFVQLAQNVWQEMEHAKAARGLVDFDDIIILAGNLLNSEGAAWVRYKLDQGIDHILVDEAQDTSAAQWRVINGLSQEFFAGAGARPVQRTLFAVGDDKQSIFSFQGAEPKLFDAQRRLIAQEADKAGERFEAVSLNLSFRSSPAVLAAVESVFANPQARGASTGDFPAHTAAKKNLPGLVELWPAEKAPDRKEMNAFTHAFDASGDQNPKARLAKRIANEIASEVRAGRVAAGDVLILVRTRNPLFGALLRELKRAGLPVAGADRLTLTEHIAAMDLMALGDAVLLPEDDLNFAALLKSPLFGLEEQDIFELAYQRPGSLHEALRRRAFEKPLWLRAYERFSSWRAKAQTVRPFEFFAQVLSADSGRDDFLRRLGHEAGEVLDEFLNAALAFESSGIATLQNFLAWLRGADVKIKREMQQGLDEVRVMTVHNAKGLEAKWIILADTADKPSDKHLARSYVIGSEDAQTVIWAPGKKNSIGPVEEARNVARMAQGEEYCRLLYVALTRAEERLTICGVQGKNKLPEDCWYSLTQQALEKTENEERDRDGNVLRWVLRHGEARVARQENSLRDATFTPPAWIKKTLPSFMARREITASNEESPREIHAVGNGQDTLNARKRGVLLHRLLEILPGLRAEERKAAAENFLRLRAPEFTDIDIKGVVGEVLCVLPLLQERHFLGKNSLAEVPFSANILRADGTQAILNGAIDRVVIEDDSLHVIDFKSGSAPLEGHTPQHYLTQLGLYRQALQPLADRRPVRCYILWTSVPRLDEIHDGIMAEALVKIA